MTNNESMESLSRHMENVLLELKSANRRDVKCLFRKTLSELPADMPSRMHRPIIWWMQGQYGSKYVLGEITRLPDSRLCQGLLLSLIRVDLLCSVYQQPSKSGLKAARMCIDSEFVSPSRLRSLRPIHESLIRPIAERALLMVADDPIGLSELLSLILQFFAGHLTKSLRHRVITAQIGLDSTQAASLMLIARKHPKYRRDAAAVALDRGGLTHSDIGLLLSYHDTRDMTEVALLNVELETGIWEL